MDLKDFQAPSALMKRYTGDHRIESFKKMSDRMDKAAKEIDRDADKLERAINGIDPDIRKLKDDVLKLAMKMMNAAEYTDNAVENMRGVATAMRDQTKYYSRELRDATETVSTLQNMYTTLGKAISKADKSGNPRDAMAAEIAAKAYQRVCKAAEKTLPELIAANKQAEKSLEGGARLIKQSYLDSAMKLERVLKRLSTFVKEQEKELEKPHNDLAGAKDQLARIRKMAK